MKIPKKITPCPIVEAIVEVRFNSKTPDEAIFGIVYDKFKDKFSKTEKLPILQIPEQIRSKDPNLRHKPCYKLTNEDLIIQVGPRVFSLANFENYMGWKSFSKVIKEIFKIFFHALSIDRVERIALRYVNLFNELNILKKSNLKIELKSENLGSNEINFIANIPSENFNRRLLIANHSEVTVNQNRYTGSIIDIDTVQNEFSFEKTIDFGKFIACINEAHIKEKELFFSLLNEEFLASLNPEY